MDDPLEAIPQEEEEEEEAYEDNSLRRWGILIGVGFGIICLGMIVVLWLGRNLFLAPLMRALATSTFTPTETTAPPPATNTPLPVVVEVTDTPTLAPTPTLMRLPPMEVMAVVSGPPLFSDPFESNDLNWVGVGENSEFTIQEGVMVVRSNQAAQPALVYCSGNCGPFKDYYYFDAELYDERGSEYAYGLVFSLNGQRNAYYAYKIRPSTNQYGLFKFQNGILYPLIDWTATAGILPAPQINVLGVGFFEKEIVLYLNGVRLNTYKDPNPYKEGQVGFIVDQDGVRLIVEKAMGYELLPSTPVAALPQAPTAQFPTAVGGTQPVFPTSTPPRASPTPTAVGSCPPYVPKGTWLLIVTRVGNKAKIEINGVVYELKELNTPFYLPLNATVVVKASGKTYEYFYTVCKVVYLKAK